MAKVRMTLTIDEDVLRAVRTAAARCGEQQGEVIEEAVWRSLQSEFLERLWERARLSEDEAAALAVEARHESR